MLFIVRYTDMFTLVKNREREREREREVKL